MEQDDKLARLREAADEARRQGCQELARDLERLAASASTSLIELGHCTRCGAESATARLRMLLPAGSRHAEDGCCSWRGALCDDCATELKEWWEGAGGALVREGSPRPPLSDSA